MCLGQSKLLIHRNKNNNGKKNHKVILYNLHLKIIKFLLTNQSCEQILQSLADNLAMSYLRCYNISKEDKTLERVIQTQGTK